MKHEPDCKLHDGSVDDVRGNKSGHDDTDDNVRGNKSDDDDTDDDVKGNKFEHDTDDDDVRGKIYNQEGIIKTEPDDGNDQKEEKCGMEIGKKIPILNSL